MKKPEWDKDDWLWLAGEIARAIAASVPLAMLAYMAGRAMAMA